MHAYIYIYIYIYIYGYIFIYTCFPVTALLVYFRNRLSLMSHPVELPGS